jgi:hypothetical protein
MQRHTQSFRAHLLPCWEVPTDRIRRCRLVLRQAAGLEIKIQDTVLDLVDTVRGLSLRLKQKWCACRLKRPRRSGINYQLLHMIAVKAGQLILGRRRQGRSRLAAGARKSWQ